MNTVWTLFLSMSLSGGLLILVLFGGKRIRRDKISRQWQYYVWLIAVLRLLLPFAPEPNLLGTAYRAVQQAAVQTIPTPAPAPAPAPQPTLPRTEQAPIFSASSQPPQTSAAPRPLADLASLAAGNLWLLWLCGALGLLLRKITIYQSFMRYIKAGLTPVFDLERLDQLAITAAQAGVRRPVELCVNPLVSSPMLIGFFHPCIVLPRADYSAQEFQYIALHELTHHKRRDICYKWFVQITVCLHWFNPLVYLMSREINRACEFSCDEAVLTKMGCASARGYGQTLLDAMASVGRYRESLGAVTLSENKQLLKERLGAIMKFHKPSIGGRLLTAVLTMCVVLGAAFVGPYTMCNAVGNTYAAGVSKASPKMDTLELKGKTYYQVANEAQLRAIGTGQYGMDLNYMQQADIYLSANDWVPIGTWDDPFTGSYNGNGFEIIGLTMTDPDAEIIGLFGVTKNAHIYNITLRDYDITRAGKNAAQKSIGAILAIGQGSRSYDNFVYPKETTVTFPWLNEAAQKAWLTKFYADGDFASFSLAVRWLNKNSPLFRELAEKAFADEKIAFFSILTDCMEEAELEFWLERALEDASWAFQSMLYNRLNKYDEFEAQKEEQEKEWAEAQRKEYQAVGVMFDGKNYYYQGKLVNVFLDERANHSFYTLNTNPAGTINIKIIRDKQDNITGAAYMTQEEVTSLFGDDLYDGCEVFSVDLERAAAGETVLLGEYTLAYGDEIEYAIYAGKGAEMKVFFAQDGQSDPVYWSVHNVRQRGELLECAADWTMEPPAAKPGTYQLYLQAPNGPLEDVMGYVMIEHADAF